MGFSVGIIDFVGNARMVTSREYGLHTLEIYLAVALVYWLLAVLLARAFGLLEEYLARRQGKRFPCKVNAGRKEGGTAHV